MSLTVTMNRLFDAKLRGARKIASLQCKEAHRLLRRARGKLEATTLAEVEALTLALRQALAADDVGAMRKHGDRLGLAVDKHLVTFRKPAWRESFESVFVAVLVALVLRAFVVEAFKIPSGSMIPTLAIGDQIFVNKYVFGIRIPFTAVRLVNFGMPERGEVVVFICPVPPNEDYIKRIVGLPGDTIEVRESTLYINGAPQPRTPLGRGTFTDRDASGRWNTFDAFAFTETIGEHAHTVLQDVTMRPRASDYGPTTVPEGHVFAMGDNRDHSFDSRAWGMVPLSNILGRSLFVWWSWGEGGLDTHRLGTWIR